ncbi:MAG: 30S ribosomal protein S17e [Nanoarchaeota archaeon]|nr:30S ribosomal protein S17e [Nanoarchaeota archaeon]
MGRIKTTMIKRTANLLIKNYPEKFTEDFEKNKKLVDEVAEIQTNKLRNIIAGYITRLTRKQRLTVS